MTNRLQSEICYHCQKSIRLGLPHFECFSCNNILHAKCFKSSKSQLINDNFYCHNCENYIPKKYNPFKVLSDCELNDPDPCIEKMSDILENCKSYTTKEINTLMTDNRADPSHSTMIFQNIDGNKTNFDAFSMELERISHNFQVIGIAETNIGVDESPVYQLEGYNAYYQDKHINKAKGTGVALYVRDNLSVVVSDELSWISKNLETLFVTIQGKEPVHVGVVYRPPSGNSSEALTELRKIIELCPKKNTYLLGDFNINLHDEASKTTLDFEHLILGLGISPLISTYTHEKPGCKQTCIDNILTNSTENTVYSGTINTCISHHLAIFHVFKSSLSVSNTQEHHIQYYDYSGRNVRMFTEALGRELNTKEPSDFDEFYSIFNNQLDTACKLERPKCSKRTYKSNPWITSGLAASISRKHELYNLWKKAEKKKKKNCTNSAGPIIDCLCSSCINIRLLHEQFRNHRRLLNYLINCAKHKYHGEKIKECIGDSKKTWEIINNIRGKKKREIKPSFVIDNERVTNRRVIANEFNKYFVSLASNLNEVYTGDYLRISALPLFTDYLPQSLTSSIYLSECNTTEITEIINELKKGKSSDIPIHVIKSSCQVIAPYLTKYFNTCMKEGYFPDKLKTGRISPIYKKEDEQLLENYRPVSTLPVFGKILEKLIYQRLYSFLISKGVINENQFGFRKGHSTSHALNYSVEHIESLTKKKQHVLGVFIDLSKAFDTLDHGKLITKLDNYGIRDNALRLIKSYLSDRKQFVNVLNEKSDELHVEYGVPQGSVLGPLLFLLYINDICNITDKGKFILFADDTNIFVAAETKIKAYDMANQVLLAVSNYMKVNLLHINVKKCCYMYFSPHKRNKNEENTHNLNEHNSLNLSINSKIINQVSHTKFLGVIIDDQLSWKPHIAALNKKLRSACGRIYRIKKCLPESLHNQIYHSLFESHLSYAISVWGGVSNNQLKPLFTTQKKCIRIIFGDYEKYVDKFRTCARVRPIGEQRLGSKFYRKESTKPLFTKHGLLAVENLYRYRCILEFFKVIQSQVPTSLYSLFSISDRKDHLVITPSPTTQFVYKSGWLWNEFRKIDKLYFSTFSSSVKNKLKRSLLNAQGRHGPDWCDKNFTEF